jgi:hypothetical protein
MSWILAIDPKITVPLNKKVKIIKLLFLGAEGKPIHAKSLT